MEKENNNQEKPRFKSAGEYQERVQWKTGEDIIRFTDGKHAEPLAYIKLEKYDDNGKPVFSCRDFEGKPLFEDNTNNLYQLKRSLKDKEVELSAALEAKSQSQEVSAPTASQEKSEVNKEVPVPEKEKGKYLKDARRGKESKHKENEQNISR